MRATGGEAAAPRPSSRALLPLRLLLLFLLLSALLHPPLVSADDPNPYTVLELPRSATLHDIKKAYRRLSMQWHPDKSADPSAPEKFTAISEAYELLSNKEKKEEYDRYGRVSPTQTRHTPHDSPPSAFHDSTFHFSFFQQHQRAQQRWAAYATHTDEVTAASPHSYKLTYDNYDFFVTSHVVSQPHTIELFLVQVYADADSCYHCTLTQSHLTQVASHLRSVGLHRIIKLGHIHADYELQLIRQLNVRSALPHVFLVVTGRGAQRSLMVPYQSTSKEEVLAQLATQFQLTASLVYPHTFDRSKPARQVLAHISRRPHITQCEVYVVSTSARPSLMVSYLAARFASSMTFLYIHMGSVFTGPRVERDIAALLHIDDGDIDHLSEGESIFLHKGDTTQPLLRLASFPLHAPPPAKTLIGLLSAHMHPHVPLLTPTTFYPLCVKPKHASSSLFAPASLSSSAPPADLCLIVVSTTQAAAEAVLGPLPGWQSVLARARLQLSWVHEGQQRPWIEAFDRSRGGRVRAILLRGATGEYQTWSEGMPPILDWAELAVRVDAVQWVRGWEGAGGGYPMLEAVSAWSDVAEQWWQELRRVAGEWIPLPFGWLSTLSSNVMTLFVMVALLLFLVTSMMTMAAAP